MLDTLFSAWPSFGPEEAEIAARVLASNKVNYWTGEECRRFETEFAAWCGTTRAVALMNGTVALDVALNALEIGPGDEVVVTPRTFIASASSVVCARATPVFADVDRDTQNITAESIANVLTPRTRAVICVHLAGQPCDMDPIMRLAKERGLKVIEDCAQAHGARYKGRSVGTLGDVGAWSFCQDKIMSTGGEGGMVTTNDDALWRRMWAYKDHGKSFAAVYERSHPPGYRWLHESIGTNWRMLEVQAAVGRWQLQRMAAWTAVRQRHAGRIRDAASSMVGLRVPPVPPWAEHAFYRCYVFAVPERLRDGWSRDRMLSETRAAGVPCFSGACPEVYLEKAFEGTASRPTERLRVARELGETSLAFLVHPTLTDEEIDKTIAVMRAVVSQAAG